MNKKMKESCNQVLTDLPNARLIALEVGITIKVTRFECNPHADSLKVMFNAEDGVRICDYWPGNGKLTCRHTGNKMKARHLFEALDAAIAERLQEIENTKRSPT